MNATSPQHSSIPTIVARKAVSRSRRAVGLVIAATVSLLRLGLTAPAFATIVPPGGGGTTGPAIPLATPTVKVINDGVATWQVALIAAGATLLGAAVVLLAARLRPARRAAAAPVA